MVTRPNAAANPGHCFETYEPNLLNQITGVISSPPFLYQTGYAFDGNGNVRQVQKQLMDDGTPPSPVWGGLEVRRFEYDSENHPLRQLVGNLDGSLGQLTQYRYDSSGKLSHHRHPRRTVHSPLVRRKASAR